MPDISAIENAPDISFIDNKAIDDVRGEMVSDFEAFMVKATGQPLHLDRASVHRMILYAATAQIYQAMQYIDRAGKQSLLKYSYSGFLDNIGLLKGVERAQPTAATTTLRFTLSAARAAATGIPQGTAVSGSGSVYFVTTEYAEAPAGKTTVDVGAVCTATGTVGNGLAVGELSNIAEPLPYVAGVTNTTMTEGGAEIESDKELANRVFLAPGAYSTAGPEDAYLYHAKKFNASIGDVVVHSKQSAGTVDVMFIMSDGSTPGAGMIAGLQEYLRRGNVRPMNDLVTVSAPVEVEYSIGLTYYINRGDSARAVSIQGAVQAAVAEFVAWQRAIGRDINPSKLVAMVMAAGAKRVDVTAPEDTHVGPGDVPALHEEAAIQYGGLEDD